MRVSHPMNRTSRGDAPPGWDGRSRRPAVDLVPEGAATYCYEVGEDGSPTRQLEVYDAVLSCVMDRG